MGKNIRYRRCAAMLAVGLVGESTAFVPPANLHAPALGKRDAVRLPVQSTPGGATDDDFVLIAPQALYTSDPNDQRYSASDWLANVKSLPRSTILRAIQGPVVSVMVWSFLVSVVHGIFKRVGPSGWAQAMCISNKPHSFLVSALGLLLVFRTNSAYQRFAEGRKIWENILSSARNISRLSCLYEGDMGAERRIRIFRLLGAFPYLLHHHIQPQCLDPSEYKNLRGTKFAMTLRDCAENSDDCESMENGNVVAYLAKRVKKLFRRKDPSPGVVDEDVYCGLDDDCETCMVDRRALPWCLLPPSALFKCAESVNRPLWICDRLSQELTNVPYTDNFTSRERLAFFSHIDKLSKSIGECERIHQTAVPLNYARHSLRSLTIWLFSLPFALVGEFGLLTAPVMGFMSWLLFGVYQIGSTIEDPFQGSLRLSILCDSVYRDVMYDADLKNKRDSAFRLDDELSEWDRLGPIKESKALASASPTLAFPAPPTSPSTPSTLQIAPLEDGDPLHDPDRPNGSSAASPSGRGKDGPMQPRP